jgi:hypothetical protein
LFFFFIKVMTSHFENPYFTATIWKDMEGEMKYIYAALSLFYRQASIAFGCHYYGPTLVACAMRQARKKRIVRVLQQGFYVHLQGEEAVLWAQFMDLCHDVVGVERLTSVESVTSWKRLCHRVWRIARDLVKQETLFLCGTAEAERL